VAHCRWPLHTSLLEGINNKIKVIKRMAYALNQWNKPGVFATEGAVPIDNSLGERDMKWIVLTRKNNLFVGDERGWQTAAVLSSLTSTCRRHAINPQLYSTQLLVNLPATALRQRDTWLHEQWKLRNPAPPTAKPAFYLSLTFYPPRDTSSRGCTAAFQNRPNCDIHLIELTPQLVDPLHNGGAGGFKRFQMDQPLPPSLLFALNGILDTHNHLGKRDNRISGWLRLAGFGGTAE